MLYNKKSPLVRSFYVSSPNSQLAFQIYIYIYMQDHIQPKQTSVSLENIFLKKKCFSNFVILIFISQE